MFAFPIEITLSSSFAVRWHRRLAAAGLTLFGASWLLTFLAFPLYVSATTVLLTAVWLGTMSRLRFNSLRRDMLRIRAQQQEGEVRARQLESLIPVLRRITDWQAEQIQSLLGATGELRNDVSDLFADIRELERRTYDAFEASNDERRDLLDLTVSALNTQLHALGNVGAAYSEPEHDIVGAILVVPPEEVSSAFGEPDLVGGAIRDIPNERGWRFAAVGAMPSGPVEITWWSIPEPGGDPLFGRLWVPHINDLLMSGEAAGRVLYRALDWRLNPSRVWGR